MKINLFIIIVCLLMPITSCSSIQNGKDAMKPDFKSGSELAEISFREYEHNFGKIVEGEKVAHIFSFENKGPGSLVISSASTSCGCTVTKYDRNPIPSGKGGNLEVVFDSNGRSGIQTKTVSVHSNSKSGVIILKVTAEVISKTPR